MYVIVAVSPLVATVTVLESASSSPIVPAETALNVAIDAIPCDVDPVYVNVFVNVDVFVPPVCANVACARPRPLVVSSPVRVVSAARNPAPLFAVRAM